MIRISYKDGQNWTSEDGLIRNWDSYMELFKEVRTQPNYIAPIYVTDIWNGLIHDVQHIVFDAYYLEFWAKESEIQEIQKIQSTDTVLITDLDNKVSYTANMQTAEWFQFNEPERVADTSNVKISFIFRTNKTVVNKFDALTNQVTLIGNSTYYSKYNKLNLPTISEQITTEWYNGSIRTLRETNEVGFRVLLYLNDSDMNDFKNDYNQNVFTIDGTAIIKKLPLDINELGENNYQVIVSVITSVSQDTKDLSPLNTHNIDIDSGTFYYTDYPVITSYQDTELDQFSNEEGYRTTAKEITRKVLLVKLFLDESDTYALKSGFETSQDVEVDGVAVLENRIVSVTQLAYDLYEVNVECLTVATPAFPQA